MEVVSILLLTICMHLDYSEDNAFSVFDSQITPASKISVPDLLRPNEDDKLQVQKVSTAQYNEVTNLEPENTLDQHSFSLPTCRISESVKKLMELAYQTLLEATTSSDQWYEF